MVKVGEEEGGVPDAVCLLRIMALPEEGMVWVVEQAGDGVHHVDGRRVEVVPAIMQMG